MIHTHRHDVVRPGQPEELEGSSRVATTRVKSGFGASCPETHIGGICPSDRLRWEAKRAGRVLTCLTIAYTVGKDVAWM